MHKKCNFRGLFFFLQLCKCKTFHITRQHFSRDNEMFPCHYHKVMWNILLHNVFGVLIDVIMWSVSHHSVLLIFLLAVCVGTVLFSLSSINDQPLNLHVGQSSTAPSCHVSSPPFHFPFDTTWNWNSLLNRYLCPHSSNPISSPLLLEQFDLNAELKLLFFSLNHGCSCRPSIRSRPFCSFFLSFSQEGDERERKKGKVSPLHLLNSTETRPVFSRHIIKWTEKWKKGNHGDWRSDRHSWDQGPDRGQHSHLLHTDDSQKRHLMVNFPSVAHFHQTDRIGTKSVWPPATFKGEVLCVTTPHERHLHSHHVKHSKNRTHSVSVTGRQVQKRCMGCSFSCSAPSRRVQNVFEKEAGFENTWGATIPPVTTKTTIQ